MAVTVQDIELVRGNPPVLIGTEKTTILIRDLQDQTHNESEIGSLDSISAGKTFKVSELQGALTLGKGDFLYAVPLTGGSYNGRLRVMTLG